MSSLATQFDGVTVLTKANVYFDGNVVSHTVLFPDKSKKTLGLIRPGSYFFGTAAAERMEIVAGSCQVTLKGQTTVTTYGAGTYFDVQPVHLLTTASLEHMRGLNSAADWAVPRFRPNFLVDTGDTRGLIEADWSGRTVRLGEVELKVFSPAPRCANTIHNQGKDVPKDPSILRSIVKHADQNLGVYCTVVKGGRVASGDPVSISN